MNSPKFDYELFFELTADLFCIAGYDGYFKKINTSVAKVLGYSMEELYSRPINDFVHPEDKFTTAKVREQLHQSKPLLNFENRYLTKSGETVWLSWTSMPVDSQQVVFAIAKNITHKKEIEEQRNSLLSQLSLLNQELKQLTFSTSHDLRAPVNNLLLAFDLLDVNKIEDQDTLELILLLRNSGRKLSDTLNKYVDVLKERHEKETAIEKIYFQSSVDQVLDSIKTLIVSSQASIQTDFSRAPQVEFNGPYLESIFLNLITNSIRYSKPGVPPQIHIRSQIVQNGVQLIVEDNGLGMDLDKMGHKLFRINQSFHGHSESKGIGLYLVYHHITGLGGKIDVESQVNQGTRFTITFP
ncbi:PAS domain S-box-containing protein [Algoriphagus aquaeductus]|jgi:PAS domain S-box-containing protein|uniref:histidine kinase n=1 Tax=Algoriphagus aquaeductus TaxID=475299 RepID=A0A326S4I6_9BACT|nr:PAS domain-containing sensor histidine kinase [Algoriphagus aquaeductus]PZV86323.1 PAS domain S-box-containing protein [Algoriphagus aquaeductus]